MHAAELFIVLDDPDLHRFTGGTPVPSAAALTARFTRLESRASSDGSEGWLNWVVREPGGTLCGYVQATLACPAADIAWVIGTHWQGRGFAGEAATALVAWLRAHGITTIRANVHPQHAASQGVARRAGLQRTTRLIDGEEVWELVASG